MGAHREGSRGKSSASTSATAADPLRLHTKPHRTAARVLLVGWELVEAPMKVLALGRLKPRSLRARCLRTSPSRTAGGATALGCRTAICDVH